jgi:TP901 family phage tail tape measure protein
MGAELAAKLSILVSTPGAEQLAKLSAHLEELARKAKSLGGAFNVSARATSTSGNTIAAGAKKALDGVAGTPKVVGQIKTVEQEMERLQRLEQKRANVSEARERLGIKSGGFMQGHGMFNTARQALAVARDVTIAAAGLRMGIQAVAGTAEAVMSPVMNFQKSLVDLGIKGGFTESQLSDVSSQIKQLATHSTFSPTEAAHAGVELAAAGVSAPGMKTALPSTLRFAQSSDLGTGESAAILVETAAQFGKATDKFESIGDVLVKAANMSTISVADLSESLKYVGPLASSAGMSLEFTAGTLALLGERGLKGSQGGTALRTMLASLVHPSKQSKLALSELHLTSKDLQKGLSDLPGFLQRINDKMNKLHFGSAQRLEVQKSLFGTEGLVAADVLTKAATDGSGAWSNYTDSMNKAGGAMKDAAEKKAKTLSGRMDAIKASTEAAAIQLGEKFVPILEKMAPGAQQAVNDVGEWISKNGDLVLSLTQVAGALAGLKLASGVLGLLPGAGALGGAITSSISAALGTSTLTAALTTSGATLAGTLMAALAAGIAGYGLTTAILAALDIDMGKVGAKIYDWLNGGTPSSGGRGVSGGKLSPSQLIEQQRRKRDGFTPEGSGPLSNDSWAAAGGMAPSNQGWATLGPQGNTPFDGKLEISITSEGKPRVMDLQTTGAPLKVGVNVMGP